MRLSNRGYELILAALVLVLAAGHAFGEGYEGVKTTQVAKSATASNGQRLRYLDTTDPEVTALLVEIPAGGETGWHLHPVPVYAYMLSGSIEVEMEDGKRYEFREGEAIFEVMNTAHNGKTLGDRPARLVVFYTGEAGRPNTVKIRRDR